MALDYQGRTPAQRFTEENYGTVTLTADNSAIVKTTNRHVIGPVVAFKRQGTGRIIGRVVIGGRERSFSQADEESPLWIGAKPVPLFEDFTFANRAAAKPRA